MLHIRKDQMKVLSGYYRKAFMKKLRSYLVDTYPVEYSAIDPENADQYFEDVMEKSKRYGIKIQRNIAEFGGFCMMYGMNFEKKNEFARTHHILTSNEMAEGTKLLQLRKFFENYDGNNRIHD